MHITIQHAFPKLTLVRIHKLTFIRIHRFNLPLLSKITVQSTLLYTWVPGENTFVVCYFLRSLSMLIPDHCSPGLGELLVRLPFQASQTEPLHTFVVS